MNYHSQGGQGPPGQFGSNHMGPGAHTGQNGPPAGHLAQGTPQGMPHPQMGQMTPQGMTQNQPPPQQQMNQGMNPQQQQQQQQMNTLLENDNPIGQIKLVNGMWD